MCFANMTDFWKFSHSRVKWIIFKNRPTFESWPFTSWSMVHSTFGTTAHTLQMPLASILLPQQHLPHQRPSWPSPTSTFALCSHWKIEPPSESNDSGNNCDEPQLHHPRHAAKPSTKWVWESKLTVTNIYNIGKDLQKCNGQSMEADAIKDYAFFDYGAEIAFIAWNLLAEDMLLPEEAAIIHLLWALFFMKLYPPKNLHVLMQVDMVELLTPKYSINISGLSLKAWPILSLSW